MNKVQRRDLIVQTSLIVAGAALTGPEAPPAAPTSNENRRMTLSDALVGAWELVSCIETDVDTGTTFLPMGEYPHGFILYTPDGYMSAQLSAPRRKHFAGDDMYRGTPEEYVAASVSYLAYSGPYYVDEARGTITHQMTVSLFPNWTGQRQVRIAKLDGQILRLATDGPSRFAGSLKAALITWRRASNLRQS